MLFKNYFSIPKLMHLLRSTRCYACETLVKYDQLLRNTLESVLNIKLSSHAWNHASYSTCIYGWPWYSKSYSASLPGLPVINIWICRFYCSKFYLIFCMKLLLLMMVVLLTQLIHGIYIR